jgi:hypothetical protein
MDDMNDMIEYQQKSFLYFIMIKDLLNENE